MRINTKNILSILAFAFGILSSGQAAATVLFEAGKTYLCSVAVESGTQPFRYQWKRNGSDIVGATSPTYVATVPGIYSVNVTNDVGTTRSDDGVLLAPSAPSKGIVSIVKQEPAPVPVPSPTVP